MRRRHLMLLGVSVLVGLAIGIVDSSPGWDSTGITAASLGLAAAGIAFVGSPRPCLWAVTVGLPTVLLGFAADADPTIALAMGFAAAGASGWAVRRSMTEVPPRAG